MTTAINGTPRPIHPPQRTTHTTARRMSRTQRSRRRAVAAAITAVYFRRLSGRPGGRRARSPVRFGPRVT